MKTRTQQWGRKDKKYDLARTVKRSEEAVGCQTLGNGREERCRTLDLWHRVIHLSTGDRQDNWSLISFKGSAERWNIKRLKCSGHRCCLYSALKKMLACLYYRATQNTTGCTFFQRPRSGVQIFCPKVTLIVIQKVSFLSFFISSAPKYEKKIKLLVFEGRIKLHGGADVS